MKTGNRLSLILIAFAVLAASTVALGAVPGDKNGDKMVSDSELDLAKQACQKGEINSSLLAEIEHIHGHYPIKLTDGTGQDVTIYSPLKRVVCFNAQVIEIMRDLKAQDRIVGVSSQAKTEQAFFFGNLSTLPEVSSSAGPNIEAALSLHPDAVMIYATYSVADGKAIQKAMESASQDIVVMHFDCFKPESHRSDVEKLGKVFEKEKEAAEYIKFYDNCIGKINSTISKIPSDKRPRVFMETSNEYATCANGSGYHQKLEMAGANNIFANLSTQYPTVDAEAVLNMDPEVVIKLVGHSNSSIANGYATDDDSGVKGLRDRMISRPGWSNITAEKSGKVYMMTNEIYGGAHYYVGVAYLAKMLYPDLFKDLDPRAIHQEYMTKFQGMDYDVKKHGVFVYPKVR